MQNNLKKRLNSNKARRNLYEINKEVGLKLENGKKRRADIIINDNILIEAKSSDTASDIQRARGQIQEYAKAWNNKGPIILLLFDYTAKDAEDFQEAMEKLWDDGFQAITILAKEKKSGQQDYNLYPFHQIKVSFKTKICTTFCIALLFDFLF